MRYTLLTIIFTFCFLIKLSSVFGAFDPNAEGPSPLPTELLLMNALAQSDLDVSGVAQNDLTENPIAGQELAKTELNIVEVLNSPSPQSSSAVCTTNGSSGLSTQSNPSSNLSPNSVAAVMGTSQSSVAEASKISVTPMAGSGFYTGRWDAHVGNAYNLGIAVAIPLHSPFILELEGGHGHYNITYSLLMHDFNQYSIGGNLIFSPLKGTLRPYAGAGLIALYYQNMQGWDYYSRLFYQYNRWIGAGQAVAGTDLALTEELLLGMRGEFVVPLFNRPYTVDNGLYSAPGFEDAAAINSTFWRLMGTVTVSF